MILESIAGYVTAAGTTFTDLTMLDRDSKSIRNYLNGTCRLLDVNSFSQGTGDFRIASPGMNDPTNGIRIVHTSGDPSPSLPQVMGFQTFSPQEVLTLQATGSATGGDIEMHHLLLQYDNAAGLDARLIDEYTYMNAVEEVIGVRVDVTAATTGVYSTAVAINATVDNFENNRVYAILGGVCSVGQGIITVQGAETGNVRVGFPGASAKKEITRDYFVKLSKNTGLPCIPIFNSANKANYLVQTTNNENAASPKITIFMGRLRKDLFPN